MNSAAHPFSSIIKCLLDELVTFLLDMFVYLFDIKLIVCYNNLFVLLKQRIHILSEPNTVAMLWAILQAIKRYYYYFSHSHATTNQLD